MAASVIAGSSKHIRRLCRRGPSLLFPWLLLRPMLADHLPEMTRPKPRPLGRVLPAALSVVQARTLDPLHCLFRTRSQYYSC